MNKQFILIFMLLMLSSVYIGMNSSATEVPPVSLSMNLSQNFVITLVGYNSNIVNPVDLNAMLPSASHQERLYLTQYDIQFANSSYSNQINNYIDTIAVADWTSSLNQTALQEQKANFGRKDIFTEQLGTAVPARELENYLAQNLPSTTLPDENRYNIFVFNLSRLDNGDVHWLNATEPDTDSGKSRDFWRLEWDYPMNYDTKFPYAAFTENEELAIIDPTAFQWYLKWRMIWNTNVASHDSYNASLTELVDAITTTNDKSAIVMETLNVWISDWVNNIFNLSDLSLNPRPLGTTLDVQLTVAYNSSQKSQSELEWIINEGEIVDETNKILHTTELNVVTNYYDVTSDTFTNNFLQAHQVSYSEMQSKPSPFADWTYYDGNEVWYSIFNGSLDNQYYTNSLTDITIKGVILLLDNASYVGESWIPWTGGLYTGLGGSGVVTMLWELGRAFMPDGSHKAGLSKVLIHEIGHAIGFPHTFTNQFTSDFASDVMGYYPGTSDYSKLYTQAYQRIVVDTKFIQVEQMYSNLYSQNATKYHDALVVASSLYDQGVQEHYAKNYVDAYFTMEQILHILQNPLTFDTSTDPTNNDTDPTKPDNKSEAFLPFAFYPFILPVITVIKYKYKKRQI